MAPYLHRQITSLSGVINIANGYSSISSLVVTAGGTGYVAGDILTVSGGTAGVTATVRVTSVSSGVVTGVKVNDAGAYTSKPSNAVSTSGGTGSGCTLTLTWSDNAAPLACTKAVIQAEAQNIRWRDDGTSPSASVGFLLVSNCSIMLTAQQMRQTKVIEAASGAILNITFYR